MLEMRHYPRFTVDGAEGGTGAAPLELSNSVGMPYRCGEIMVRNLLVGAGLKDRVKIAASGRFTPVRKPTFAGADWCNAARPFMFSLGCVQSSCHTNELPDRHPRLLKNNMAARAGGGRRTVARFNAELAGLRSMSCASR
jgi:glutamate synthase domain-containing protein 2